MALATNALPYGLRDVKLYPLDATTGLATTGVDLPASRIFSFSEAEEYEELRGDDKLIAIKGKGPKVEWELEAGGISFVAYQLIAGGTITNTGTTPNLVSKLKKKVTDIRPYFRTEGQAISDSGGDFHARVFKCKADGNVEGKLEDGTFWLSHCTGSGLGDVNDDLYEFVQNETATAVTTTPT